MRGSVALSPVLALAVARAAVAQPAPVVDDRPAEAGAVAAAQALVAEGTALGEANKYEVALGKFLIAASEHPSATHDCLVALAYLRIGRLTLARLWLDAAPRRGDAQPAWCATTIADELDAALTTRGFVAVAVAVTPADADLWIGEAHVRGGRTVWLPPGEVEVRAERAGHAALRRTEVAASGARFSLALEPIEDAALGGVTTKVPAAAGPPAWTWAPLVVGGAALVGGGVFHVLAVGTRDEANALPASSSAFAELDRRFGRQRALAIGGYAVGAVGVATGLWLRLRERDESAPALGVAVERHHVTLTWSWTR